MAPAARHRLLECFERPLRFAHDGMRARNPIDGISVHDAVRAQFLGSHDEFMQGAPPARVTGQDSQMGVVHHVRQAPDPFVVDQIVDRASRIGWVLGVRLACPRQVMDCNERLRALGGTPDGPTSIVRYRLKRFAVAAHEAQAHHQVGFEVVAGRVAAGCVDDRDGGVDLAELCQDETLAREIKRPCRRAFDRAFQPAQRLLEGTARRVQSRHARIRDLKRRVDLHCCGEASPGLRDITKTQGVEPDIGVDDRRQRIEPKCIAHVRGGLAVSALRRQHQATPDVCHGVARVQLDGPRERPLGARIVTLVLAYQTQRGVCLRQRRRKFQRPQGGRVGVRDRFAHGYVAVVAGARQRVRVGETRIGQCIAWIALDRLPEAVHRPPQRCLGALVEVVAPEEVQVVGIETPRRRLELWTLRSGRAGPHSGDDSACDLSL